MWQDMGTYWAWRGKEEDYYPAPTEKRLVYASFRADGCVTQTLCVGVYDDEFFRDVNPKEAAWLLKRGYVVAERHKCEYRLIEDAPIGSKWIVFPATACTVGLAVRPKRRDQMRPAM